MNDMSKKNMKRRAYALEAALGAVKRSGEEFPDPKTVLKYARFILGKESLRDFAAGQEEPDATSGQPVGEDPGDREVLTQWAEVIRQQDAAREAAREAAALEVEPEEKEVDASLLKPLPPAEKAPREDLSATWAPQRHAAETSEKAPDHVVREGASLGCAECSTEAERREKRDEAKEEGRQKLAERLDATIGRTGPLDDDELLAVAGSELYPANDEEPSREVRIRNRRGEVKSFQSVPGATGWTAVPGNPWSLHLAWTSSEMTRRGPWHVV